MPRVVDYSARFAFLRRAAFVVVRDRGPAALSRRTVADALGTSVNSVQRLLAADADLRHLALDEVERRRSSGRWWRPRGLAGEDLAVFLLRQLLPDADDRIAEELVLLRLVLVAHRLRVALAAVAVESEMERRRGRAAAPRRLVGWSGRRVPAPGSRQRPHAPHVAADPSLGLRA